MICKVWCFLMVVVAVVMMMVMMSGVRVMAMTENIKASPCGDGEECVFLSTCRPLQDLVASRRPGVEETIKEAICGTSNGRDLRVCCPETGSFPSYTFPGNQSEEVNGEDLLPKGNECGITLPFKYALFGRSPPINAYPWMALLGYQERSNPLWRCGGALINDRYVLTAAHCVHQNFTESQTKPLVTVRLGEHNTTRDPDCESNMCAASLQEFLPQEITIHEDFNTRGIFSDNIALIRLDRKITKTMSVYPVCLPGEGLDVQTFLESRDAKVAGWGTIQGDSSSDILELSSIPFVDKSECEAFYRFQLVDQQMCFLMRGNDDTCSGDSGGPLFQENIKDNRFFLLGVHSISLSFCDYRPAIYTNVASYRKWITDNIKP